MAPAGSEPMAAPAVILRATDAQAHGAGLVVAGLTVFERAVRQLRRGHRVVIATDGSVPLPDLPPDVQVRTTAQQREVQALARELGGAPIVDADVVRPHNRSLENGLRVTDEDSQKTAEDAIFNELLRGDLGLVARHLNKPVSFRITRHVLCRLPVTPNQVTLGAAAIGLCGALLIGTGRYGLMVLGLVLAHLQSVLDGCDGELARVRFQQSPIGEWLDTIVDDFMNLSLVTAVGVGLFHRDGSLAALGLGIAAAGMLLTYNAVAYSELLRQGEGGEVLKIRWWFQGGASLKDAFARDTSWGPRRILLMMGRRDFFVLAWLLLVAVGLPWVVLVYAVGVAGASFAAAVGQLLIRRRA